MFYAKYLLAELRRRWGRTFLTAAGLGVGVALVVATTAFSAGLRDAQEEVLAPLTGVGTDMTVTRPLTIDEGDSGFAGLSEKERKQLEEENGGGRIAFDDLGEPGEKFENDRLTSGSQLSFATDVTNQVAALSGVEDVGGSLTLTNMHTSGTVPDIEVDQGGGFGEPPEGGKAVANSSGTSTSNSSRSPVWTQPTLRCRLYRRVKSPRASTSMTQTSARPSFPRTTQKTRT